METFNTILQTVWRPAQKNSWEGCINPPYRARVNPRDVGGKYYPLPDIGYNLKTAHDNGTKLWLPYLTSIWHFL